MVYTVCIFIKPLLKMELTSAPPEFIQVCKYLFMHLSFGLHGNFPLFLLCLWHKMLTIINLLF